MSLDMPDQQAGTRAVLLVMVYMITAGALEGKSCQYSAATGMCDAVVTEDQLQFFDLIQVLQSGYSVQSAPSRIESPGSCPASLTVAALRLVSLSV